MNSDSEQCTESKLSRVHSAPTLGPACAHTVCALYRVAGLAWSCCRPGPAMSQAPLAALLRPHTRRVAGRVLCTVLSLRASCRAPPAPYHGAPCAVSWHLPRPCRACLAIQPSSQAMRVGSTRRPAVLRASWRCRGAVSQGFWPYRGPLLHAPEPCVTIQSTIS